MFIALATANAAYKVLNKHNQEWIKKPWRKIKPEYEQVEAYDQKSGEFLFYGADWCHPCKTVARFLVNNKIKYREIKDENNKIPFVDFQGNTLNSSEEIVQCIRKMYGI